MERSIVWIRKKNLDTGYRLLKIRKKTRIICFVFLINDFFDPCIVYQTTHEYRRLRETSEIFPSDCSELRPNSLDPALKLTSKLLGVHTLLLTNQQDSCLDTFDTGLGPFFFQTNLAAMIILKGTDGAFWRTLKCCLSVKIKRPSLFK